ncbi:hypothetical protein D0C16_19415 [Cellvibrio sp. KY-GH-1]|uniref:pilus assembly PilX family protein n=1 Tax=Cellvibrio sp. KY-GH-1 TaxID=2303332 RepID=UPI001248739D|nr:PilX N-terminal domain-containing pilus assembly protein [Cellvibrio sp. KY-GH-1]QEY17967.1 hypothetical protein D0C16_19415 [Cellvibrio sp. KY-GH-1]
MSYLNQNYRSISSKTSQQGVVLLVGLVMVLLITIVGLSAIRGTGLQESMAGNMRDLNLAFQSAESGLRFAESIVSISVKTVPPFDCTAGLCVDQERGTPANSVRWWNEESWAKIAVEADLGLKNVEHQPRIILELLDSDAGSCAAGEGSGIGTGSLTMVGDCIPYRITALGYGADENTQVMVQSAYKRHQ